jgi:hypothetical protein
LRTNGIGDAEDLLWSDPWALGHRLGVEPATVKRWQQIAKLTVYVIPKSPTTGSPSAVALVALLLAVKVTSIEQLQSELTANEDKLYRNLVQAAVDMAIVPTRAETVRAWNRP